MQWMHCFAVVTHPNIPSNWGLSYPREKGSDFRDFYFWNYIHFLIFEKFNRVVQQVNCLNPESILRKRTNHCFRQKHSPGVLVNSKSLVWLTLSLHLIFTIVWYRAGNWTSCFMLHESLWWLSIKSTPNTDSTNPSTTRNFHVVANSPRFSSTSVSSFTVMGCWVMETGVTMHSFSPGLELMS